MTTRASLKEPPVSQGLSWDGGICFLATQKPLPKGGDDVVMAA